MSPYHATSPVLFLIFNRPDTTLQVFEKIRETQPAKLYIAADGPRKDRPEEEILCEETRSIIQKIDWQCDVKMLFREENLGCKYGVSTAITWFFEHEEEGIILEDDCLPVNDFFRFCDTLLEKYRYDSRITQIAGCNFQRGKQWEKGGYYFSNNLEVWGWASWKRVWKNYDVNLEHYTEDDVEKSIDEIFKEPLVTKEYVGIFRQLKEGKIDTWDYQLKLITFFNKGLCIIPNVNLISNIGFRADATHTHSADDQFANAATGQLPMPLTHPDNIQSSKEADAHILNLEFNLEEKKRKHNKLSRRFKRWIKRLFRN